MKEKIRLEKKKGKILAHFIGKTWHIVDSVTLKEAKEKLEGDGYLVELVQ